MTDESDIPQLTEALVDGIRLLVRRMRQVQVEGELKPSESSALARLDRVGPTTSSALARIERISAQSMGATLAGLQARGLIERRPDPEDGRRVVLTLTDAGRAVLRTRKSTQTEKLTAALADEFTPDERERLREAVGLVERLARRL
ncbi:MarR family winged helix-turn-helix transcriptional regulator [Actinomadura atramentaria]|uniref:MarR family winged helix-turn-helix transcriptional regulator n=1 Tax=Actinomadura atramentaria TaxID=1990 RepID=UPI0003A66687|nr:MarR family transcriptional regulator [Actinomadura atramentaria]